MIPITNTQAKLFDKKFVALALRDFRRCDKCKREYDIKFKVSAADNKPHSSRPVLLNCGHNICENCIYQHRHNLTCAVCLAPTEFEHTRWLKKSYDLNFCLLGQLTNVKSFLSSEAPGSSGYVQGGMLAQDTFVQKCSECEQALAVGICMHCKVDFCKRCFISVHQNSKVLKQHKLSEFEIQTLQLQLPKEKICKMHKRLCDKFCSDCTGIYCLQCIRSAHSSHRVCPLSAENENHKNRIVSFLETMKQTRESIRKAQKEARICENQLEDFATEVILEVNEYFLELHNHLQLEERRILDEFKKAARGSQKAILEAFSRLSDSQTTLNNMKSSLQGYIHKPPHNFHINTVLELATVQLEQMPCQIQISAIEKSPFTFKKLKNLQQDISSSYEVIAIDPKLKIRITPMYGDLAHAFETSSDRASSPEPLSLTRMESMDNYHPSVVSTSLSSAVPIGRSKRIGRITNIISPSEFFVQEEDAIGKIRLLLDKFDESIGHVESVTVGKLYLVYHVADKAWFRGVVRNDSTEKLPKNCENFKYSVFLIDYGIFIDISKKWFRQISEELSAIPEAAAACKLLDITPAEGQWTKEARELMEEIIQNKPVQVLIQDTTKSPWDVEVFTLHTGDPISLREALLYTGLGIDSSAASSQRNIKFAGTKEPTLMSKMKHRLSRPVLHPGEVFRVKITHIENPQQFFAVRFAQLDDLTSLENELDFEYSNKQSNPIYYAKLHMCCVLLFEEKWYRGCIEDIKDPNNIRVRLVDNGRYVTVSWRELRVLKESFTNSPEFSIECSLADIQPLQENDYEWTQIAIAEFVRMSSNPNIQMIVSTSHQFRYQVIINVIKKHLDINIGAMLVKFKHALTTGEGSATIENVRKSKSPIDQFFIPKEQNKQQSVGSSEVPSIRTLKRTPIQVIHIVDPGEFYIHLVEHIPGILKLHEELQLEQEKLFQSEESLKDIDWQVNDHCMVLTSINDSASQQWYRGILLRTDDYDPDCPFVVFLRDKGLTIHDLSKKQLTTISNLFDRVCNGAILCHLACVYPTSGMKTWSHSSTDEFSHSVTTFESLGATIQGETLNGSIPVVLWGLTTESNDALAPCTTKYMNINKNLVWAGLAHLAEKIDITLQMDKFVETELEQGQQTLQDWYEKFKKALEVFPECNETLESDTEKSAISPYDFDQPIEDGKIITDWLPAEPIEKTLFTAYPTYVDEEAIVYLHDADKHSLLTRIRVKINEIVELKSPSKSQIKVGQPCLARYHLDKSLYRATIVGLLPDKKYEVHFVDYGNTETCVIEDLYTTIAFPNIPIQAVRFRIDGIKPRGSKQKFSVTVLDLIHGVIVDKLCAIRVSAGEEDNEIKKCSIRFDQNDLAVYLIENSFASPVSNKMFKAASNMNINRQHPSNIIPTSVAPIEEDNSQDELREFMKEQICDPTGDNIRKTAVTSPKENVAMFNPDEYKRMFDKLQNDKLYKSITDLDSESSPVLNEELDENIDDDEDVVELEFSFKSNYWVTDKNVDPIARSEVGSNFETFDPMDTSSLLSNFSGIEAFKAPQLPSSVKSFYCDVAYARSSTILHIFPHLSELQYRQIELARRIQLVVRKISPLTHFEVKTPCLARYSKDKLWYRAIIRSHNASTRQVKVFYVDFLNTEQVSEEYVRRCPKELLSFPLRTFEMKLFALKPNSRLREKDVKEAVKKCLSERTLYAKIMRDRGKIPEICLYKSKTEKEEPIYQDLIIQKYFSKE